MKKKQQSLAAFVWANFRLQRGDFLIIPAIVAGTWLVIMLILAAITFFSGDNEIFGVGIPGLLAVIAAVMTSMVTAISRIWLEFRIGVQMGVTRRRMMVAELALSLATGAEGLAAAWLLDRAWMALAERFAARFGANYYEPLIALMPLWGWLLAWLLPAALGCAIGALVLRYGARAGWTVYLVVMLACCTSSSWLHRLIGAVESVASLAAALPALGFALAAAGLLAAVLMLRRVSVNN